MKILTLRFTSLTGRARCALRVSVIGTDRVRGYGTALMTARRLHVPEISRGRLAVTSGLLKTIGAPPWAIMPLSIDWAFNMPSGHAVGHAADHAGGHAVTT